MTKKESSLLIIGLILFVATASYFAGVDAAMEHELHRQRISVYCQQPEHNETLCHNIEE